MARLPVPGSDDNTWGDVLNTFLEVEHNNDGTLKSTGSLASKASDAAVVHNSGAETVAGSKTFSASPSIPTPTSPAHASTKAYVDSTVAASTTTPAISVTNETSYGQASATGISTNYAREDHTHGTPSLTSSAPAVTEGIGTAAATGIATTPAHADHVHPMATAGAPNASAVGDTQATGAATTFAASDHRHAREAFGTVTALTAFNTAASSGTALTVAHADHVHGAPTLATFTVPSIDQATTSVTVEDITNLGLSVGIGTYEFDFLIPYTASASGASGILLALAGPTSSFLSYVMEIQSAQTTNGAYYRSVFASNQAGVSVVTGGSVYVAKIRGRVTTTASGTLQPRFGITVGATTTTAKVGMYGKLTPYA